MPSDDVGAFTPGRLYLLPQPDALPQLLYYGNFLAVPIPFTAARESIMTLFEPTLSPVAGKRRFSAIITAIVRSHAIIFMSEVGFYAFVDSDMLD